ncbi:uncharacterized protein DMAD_08632 [Drosophila madeirensis]|uniref:Uncharacterized protein n=1 Tax=Drosophila madeirensis TaxID=30013 RepID=A0AAU9ESU4_DROMD
MTRHLMPLKTRTQMPASPQHPVGPILSMSTLQISSHKGDGDRASVSEECSSEESEVSFNRDVMSLYSDASTARTEAETVGDRSRKHKFKGQKIPRQGDFRSYFELDEASKKILWTMAYHRRNVDGLHDRILDYMERFYHLRCPSHDEMIFQWFLLEGFYPLLFLLGRPVEEIKQSSDEQLDKSIRELRNRCCSSDTSNIPVNEAMAKYMICAYFRVLFHYAIRTDMDMDRRTLLRCRFAVNVVEVFMQHARGPPESDPERTLENRREAGHSGRDPGAVHSHPE